MVFEKGHIEILLLGFKGIFENLEEIVPIWLSVLVLENGFLKGHIEILSWGF